MRNHQCGFCPIRFMRYLSLGIFRSLVQKRIDRVSHKNNAFKVNARFRLIQKNKVGALGQELEQFRTLYLAA